MDSWQSPTKLSYSVLIARSDLTSRNGAIRIEEQETIVYYCPDLSRNVLVEMIPSLHRSLHGVVGTES